MDLKAQSDRKLIELIARGESGATSALFRRYFRSVYGFVHERAGGDVGMSEELTQDTFLDAWRNLAAFDRSRELWPWLRGIARRKIAHAFQGSRSPSERRGVPLDGLVEQLEGGSPLPEAALENAEVRAAIGRALSELSPRHQELLRLKYVDGEKLTLMGRSLGLTETAVSSGLQRARRALTEALGSRMSEERDHVL